MPEIQPFSYAHTVKVPRSLVYPVHTRAEHVAKWFGPAGTKSIQFEMDFRVGGVNHYGIEIPGGVQMWWRQVYVELVPNQKIVHIQSALAL